MPAPTVPATHASAAILPAEHACSKASCNTCLLQQFLQYMPLLLQGRAVQRPARVTVNGRESPCIATLGALCLLDARGQLGDGARGQGGLHQLNVHALII